MRLGEDQAAALVRARLGRPPLDPLELAVTLEAWGGVRPAAALAIAPGAARRVVVAGGARPGDDHGSPPSTADGEAPVLVASVLSTVALLAALAARLPAGLVGGAWRAALPVALALHGLLRRRHPAASGGRPLHHERVPVFALLAAACAASVATGTGTPAVAALLAAVFAAPPLLAPHRSAWLAVLATCACAVAVLAGAPVGVAVAVTTATVIVIAVVPVDGDRLTGRRVRPAWRSAVPAGLSGFAFGVLVVCVASSRGGGPAVEPLAAAAPGAAGSLAAGLRLRRVWFSLRAAQGTWATVGACARAIVLGAAVAAVSVAVLAAVVAGTQPDATGRFLTLASALCLVALLGTLAGLADAFRLDAALVAATVGPALVGAASPQLTGALLATGAGIACSAIALGARLRDPAWLLATMP